MIRGRSFANNKFSQTAPDGVVLSSIEVGNAPDQFSLDDLAQILAIYNYKPPVAEVVVGEAKGLFRRRK